MSDDKKLGIKIAIESDVSGGKDAEKSIQKVTSAAQEADKATGALVETQNSQSKALGELNDGSNDLTANTKKYIESLSEENNQEKKSIGNKHESREVLRALGEQFGIVGEIGRVAMMGVVGAVLLLIKAVGSAYEQIQEFGKRSTPEFETLTKAVEDQKDAIEDVELAANSYERSLSRLAVASQTVQAASAAYQAQLKAHSDNESSGLDKRQERDGAILEAAEAQGLITHAQYLAKKLALDEDYAKKRIAIENKLQADLLIEKYREKANTEIEANTLQRTLPTKTAAARNAAGKEAFSEERLNKDKADLEKTLAKLEELSAEREEMQGVHPFQSEYVLLQKAKQNDTETTAQMEIAVKLRDQIKHDEERRFNAKNNKGAADEDLQVTRDRLTQDRTRVGELNRDLPGETKIVQEQIAQRGQNSEVESQTRMIKTAGSIAQGQGKVLTDLGGLLETVNGNQSDLSAALRGHHQVTKSLQTEVRNLKSDMKTLMQQQSQQAHDTGGH